MPEQRADRGDRLPGNLLAGRSVVARALTKMDWNQTRLDGQNPITIRAANQVGAVLRFSDPAPAVAARYANYL